MPERTEPERRDDLPIQEAGPGDNKNEETYKLNHGDTPALISRQEAAKLGLSRYFTGAPCPRGHTNERRVKSAVCIVCDRTRKRPAKYRARKIARQKDWRAKNPDLSRARSREYAGLPAPSRPEPKTCEACGGKPNDRYGRLHLDHCHKTGKFRGWLCFSCNSGIGHLDDSIAGVERALKYLRRVGSKT